MYVHRKIVVSFSTIEIFRMTVDDLPGRQRIVYLRMKFIESWENNAVDECEFEKEMHLSINR